MLKYQNHCILQAFGVIVRQNMHLSRKIRGYFFNQSSQLISIVSGFPHLSSIYLQMAKPMLCRLCHNIHWMPALLRVLMESLNGCHEPTFCDGAPPAQNLLCVTLRSLPIPPVAPVFAFCTFLFLIPISEDFCIPTLFSLPAGTVANTMYNEDRHRI